MLGLIFIILFAIGAVACFVFRNRVRKIDQPDDDQVLGRKVLTGVSWVLAVVTVLVLILSCTVQVSTKNVGIETAFGKTTGHLSNGLHVKAPWVSVTEMDAAIQTDSYTSKDCLTVRIANQQTACVHVSIRWRIQPGAADYLFQNYRTFDNVRDSLVTRELTASVNTQLANYNALNSVDGGPSGTASNPSLAQIGADVTKQMRSEIGQYIDVLSTIIPFMSFDPQTQQRLNQLNQQQAQTRIAAAAQATAQAQSVANQDLAASVSNNPNVLVAECLQDLKVMAANGNVPAGFSCWPANSSGVTGIIAKA